MDGNGDRQVSMRFDGSTRAAGADPDGTIHVFEATASITGPPTGTDEFIYARVDGP